MATKTNKKKAEKKAPATKRLKYVVIRRVFASVSMLSFGVVILGGVMARASTIAIAWRALVVITGVAAAKWLLLRTWDSFEEMRRGQA